MLDALLDALVDALLDALLDAMFDPRTQEFNSKLISLLPLDEVPVHVHPFAARAPCDSKCGIHRAETA